MNKVNNNTVNNDNSNITIDDFKNDILKLSHGKKITYYLKLLISFFNFSNVLVINLGVKVLIGLTLVFKSFGYPLILKLTPKLPHLLFSN